MKGKTQSLWDAAKAVKREFYSNTISPQETRKTSNKQPNLTPKATRDRTNVTQRVEGKKNH